MNEAALSKGRSMIVNKFVYMSVYDYAAGDKVFFTVTVKVRQKGPYRVHALDVLAFQMMCIGWIPCIWCVLKEQTWDEGGK